MADLVLADGFAFEDLYSVEGLTRLDAAFFAALQADRPDLAKRLKKARLDAAFAASLVGCAALTNSTILTKFHSYRSGAGGQQTHDFRDRPRVT